MILNYSHGWMKTGTLAAQRLNRLSLLPSGPDEVHSRPLRKTDFHPTLRVIFSILHYFFDFFHH